MERFICVIIGYAFGLLQTGYLYGKLHHVDIRKQGSGNAGSTNALRTMGWKLFPAALVISLPGTVVSSTITAVVFGGITSSGSTVLVQLLHSLGMNLTLSVCVVQAMTDFVDRMIVLAVVLVILPAVSSAFGSLSMRSRK